MMDKNKQIMKCFLCGINHDCKNCGVLHSNHSDQCTDCAINGYIKRKKEKNKK